MSRTWVSINGGEATSVKAERGILIDDFKDLVKEKTHSLKEVDSYMLKVYVGDLGDRTKPMVKVGEPLYPDKPLPDGQCFFVEVEAPVPAKALADIVMTISELSNKFDKLSTQVVAGLLISVHCCHCQFSSIF
jgi:hypothetical protein